MDSFATLNKLINARIWDLGLEDAHREVLRALIYIMLNDRPESVVCDLIDEELQRAGLPRQLCDCL